MNDAASLRIYAWLFWIPLASLIATEVYVSNFDGMGAWAAAPLFLLPLFLSIVISGAGLMRCLLGLRRGTLPIVGVLLTAVAAAPLLWLLVRRFVM